MKAAYFLAICAAVVHGQDVIVATDRRILRISERNTTTLMEYENTAAITGYRTVPLAADPVDSRVFFALPHQSPSGWNSTAIGYVNVQSSPKPQPVTLLSREGNNAYHARGLSYDHVRGTLHWTSMINHSIQRCSVAGGCADVEYFSLQHHTDPAAIAVDPYRGYVFWTDNNHQSPGIIRMAMSTNHTTCIVRSDLFMPNGLAIDTSDEGTIYWTDDSEGDAFKIESANLDGSNRHTIHSGHYQKPMDLAFSRPSAESPKGALYWSDWISDSVWRLELAATARKNRGLTRMASLGDHGERPMGIVAMDALIQRDNEVEMAVS